MIRKIVLFGPECTGKTTLARQLAEHFRTVWVPEYARLYQEQKGAPLNLSDVIPVARGQMALEDQALPAARQVLICDTDILETKVYSEAYNGTCPDWLLAQIPARSGDLYLLTDVDLPWEADGIRDRPDDRAAMHQRFRNELIRRQLPFVEIAGEMPERFRKAVAAVEARIQS